MIINQNFVKQITYNNMQVYIVLIINFDHQVQSKKNVLINKQYNINK